MEGLFNVFLNVLIASLFARYCYIHEVADKFAAGFIEATSKHDVTRTFVAGLAEAASKHFNIPWAKTEVEDELRQLRSANASLLLRSGGVNYGGCNGTDYAFTGKYMNERPVWQSEMRKRVIVFNGRSWVCTHSKYLVDIQEGSLKNQYFGGYVMSEADQDASFEKSTWKDFFPRFTKWANEAAQATEVQPTKSSEPSDMTKYRRTRVALRLRPGESDTGCAAEDYFFAGQLNGRPYFVSHQKSRFVGFNGERWICSGVEFLKDIQHGSLKNKKFGGFDASEIEDIDFEKSTWDSYTVRMIARGDPAPNRR